MANTIHNGSELNNIRETWDRNEKERANDNSENRQEDTTPATKLDEIIQQEANEYDNENKENRLLGGDRASVNDGEGNE